MNSLVTSAIANTFSFFKQLQIQRFLAAFLIGGLLLFANVSPVSANTNYQQDNSSSNGRFLERMQKIDEKSERPKTTGEFLEEARGDVPLNERIDNIARDSAEAFGQFGKLYTTGAQETARTLKDKAAQAGENLVK